MKKLTEKETEVMRVIWHLEKAFIREVIDFLPKPKPHRNTISTIIGILKEKGYVDREAFGNTFRYFPIISKEAYSKKFIGTAINDYFDNSYKNLVAFFAKEDKISADELREIIDMIEKNKSE